MNTTLTASVLTIAGSDSGGGAGIQADLKTFAAHRVHGLSAIAALTAQNTRGVKSVAVPSTDFLRDQIDACFEDFDIRAVKLGMLANAAVIQTVAEALRAHAPAHIVLDPVMVATSGARLLEPQALTALRSELFPLATLLTPNIPEATLLLDRHIDTADADTAITDLLAMGLRAVLLKGGHFLTDTHVTDYYGDARTRLTFVHPRHLGDAHGTGCTLASAIAASLALDLPLPAACKAGIEYVAGALAHAYRPGNSGTWVLDHFHATLR